MPRVVGGRGAKTLGLVRAAGAHHAAPVRTFVAAHPADYRLESLPPYAPDLNPEVLCNGAVKRALRNAAPGSVDDLHRLGRRPALLHSYTRHTGLRVSRST
jgi:transposase